MPLLVSFDKLPVELIYKIFNYLAYHEIFTSFHHVNSRLNNILDAYDRYHVNFQSISLSHFNISLKYMRPEQIIALTLSNMDDTPKQIQLFLSLFSIKQFTRLEKLVLIQLTNSDQFDSILLDLSYLNSLSLLSIIHCQPSSIGPKTIEYLTTFLNKSTSLRQLHLSGALNSIFEYNFHSNVNYLSFNDNVFNTVTLPNISSQIPHLETLETAITSTIVSTNLPNFTRLTRLNIIIFVNMTNSEMRCLLDSMSSLTHLRIVANGKQWFNGHFWEQSVPINLLRFEFNFCTQSIHLNETIVLETFQTPFWLTQKRWHVMLDYQMNPTMVHLYSLPYCDSQFYYRPSSNAINRCRFTASIDSSYMRNVTKLTLDFSSLITETNPSDTFTHSFPNVTKLILSDNGYFTTVDPFLSCLQSVVNLKGIVELKLGHFHYPDLIRLIHSSMPRLNTLWIAETMFAKLEMIDFRHIRSLTICDSLTNVDRLCLMFPNLVTLTLRLATFDRMRRVIELLDRTIQTVTFKQVTQPLQAQFLPWLMKHCENRRQISYEIDRHLSLHIWFGSISH